MNPHMIVHVQCDSLAVAKYAFVGESPVLDIACATP